MKILKHTGSLLIALTYFSSSAQDLRVTVQPGLALVASDSLKMVFNEASFINNGSLLPGKSTVIFTGSSFTNNTFIGGGRPVSFHNLVIDRLNNDLALGNNILVDGVLRMDNGNLQLNNYMLDLGSTGHIEGERNSARIQGQQGGVIKVAAVLHAPRAVNPGNIGVEISSDADLGNTVITRSHETQLNIGSGRSIERNFTITPEKNTGLRASLRFYYLEAELGEHNKTELSIFSKSGYTGWAVKGKDKTDMVANWIVKNNIDQLGSYTLAKPLPSAFANRELKSSLQVFPNPARDRFQLLVVSDVEKDDMIYLTDQLGKKLEYKRVHYIIGTNSIVWDIGKYPQGVYYLAFTDGGWGTVKVIRQ